MSNDKNGAKYGNMGIKWTVLIRQIDIRTQKSVLAKSQTNPKIKSKSNVRIEGNLENESCSTIWVDPKQFSNPTPTSKIAS